MEITLIVNTTADQNDGSPENGLSLREAIIIANQDTSDTDYNIIVTGGETYQLTAANISDDSELGGDLDIYGSGLVKIRTNNDQLAAIDASSLAIRDRVIEVGRRVNNVVNDAGNLFLENIVITGGQTSAFSNGGGILVRKGLGTIVNSIVIQNVANERGGGIANNEGTLFISNSLILNNQVTSLAVSSGGGINNEGTLTVLNSTIDGNISSTVGGGISNSRTATIINSSISNNQSATYGGGYYSVSGTLSMTNVTVSGNISRLNGGGLSVGISSVTSITNSTITNNTASFQGGGLEVTRANVNLRNTLITGNQASVGVDSFGYNYDVNERSNIISRSYFNDAETIIPDSVQLSPLQDNGGLTFTHALLEGSAALDRGNNSSITTDSLDVDNDGNTTEPFPFDQRGSGYARINGNAVDIGAFELQPPPPTISINNATAADDLANSSLVFTVILSYASSSPVSVQYTTQDGSALAGSDYLATSGTLTFAPGQNFLNIAVPIITDSLVEIPETFTLVLANPTNATLANNVGTGTLTNIDPAQYGASQPDLLHAFQFIQNYEDKLSAFADHYQNNGRFEGRNIDNFDELRYIASNPDLILAFRDNVQAGTQHYIQHGFAENRSLISFHPSQYLASHPDLLRAFQNNPDLAQATFHFINHGFDERRSPDSFDEARYLLSHDDLLNAFGANTEAATQHYLNAGFWENRDPQKFQSDNYIASHPDLIEAFHYNLEVGSNHYLNFGRIEGRQITFNPQLYLDTYVDLQTAFNGDLVAATRHFIEYGFSEGRIV